MTTAADITAMNTAIAAVTDAATAKTALQAVSAVVSDFNTTISVHDSDITEVMNSLSDLNDTVSGLQTTVSGLSGVSSSIAALQTAVTALQTDLASNTASDLLRRVDSATKLQPSDPYSNGSEIGSGGASSGATEVTPPSRTSGPISALVQFSTAEALPGGVHSVAYSKQLQATGGVAGDSLTYVLDSRTSLPAGLTLSSTGLLAGTPTTAGNYSFIITVRDAHLNSESRKFAVTIS